MPMNIVHSVKLHFAKKGNLMPCTNANRVPTPYRDKVVLHLLNSHLYRLNTTIATCYMFSYSRKNNNTKQVTAYVDRQRRLKKVCN